MLLSPTLAPLPTPHPRPPAAPTDIIDTKLAQIRLDPSLSNQLNAAVMSILTKSASGEISHDEQERAIGALKSAAFFSTVWDGSAYGASPVDLRMQVPFVSFSMITEIEVHLAGLRSIVFFVCVLKTLRYMQAWRPLAERYAAIMQNVPYILRFFLLLTHLHACFSVQVPSPLPLLYQPGYTRACPPFSRPTSPMLFCAPTPSPLPHAPTLHRPLQAYLLFGFDLIEFQTLGSSFLQLLQLLTGKITVAKGLIELDYQSSSFIGHLVRLTFATEPFADRVCCRSLRCCCGPAVAAAVAGARHLRH